MTFEKQIEEIIAKIGKFCGFDESGWEKYFNIDDAAKEIASLYEGWYPGEFIEWKDENCRAVHVWFAPERMYIIKGQSDEKEFTLPELFKYWQDNVEGK